MNGVKLPEGCVFMRMIKVPVIISEIQNLFFKNVGLVRFEMFLKENSSAHQDCVCSNIQSKNKNTNVIKYYYNLT